MPFKKKNQELDQYLDASNELTQEESGQTPVQNIQKSPESYSASIPTQSRLKRLHFWSEWDKKKKIIFFTSVTMGVLLLLSLIFAFIVRPSRTNAYIKNSWYDVVSSSSSIERAVKSEVNLEGTRDLADSLYSYNEKLSSLTYESRSKNNISYTSRVSEFAEVTDQMGSYYSESATLLSKASSEDTTLEDSKIEELKSSGDELRSKVNEFRQEANLSQELSADLLSLDIYISNVKLKKEEIEKEKKEEEKKKKQEEQAASTKQKQDKANVEAISQSYYTAFINGNEAGVRATLSRGFQTEYDYAALKAERRTNFYPKSFRVISVEKDGENYKVTSSVTYISIYQDSEGNNIENSQPITEIYRVIYSTETGSWKLDGRTES
jgi:hypothetical protein